MRHSMEHNKHMILRNLKKQMEQQLFMSEKAEANSQLQIEKFFKDGV